MGRDDVPAPLPKPSAAARQPEDADEDAEEMPAKLFRISTLARSVNIFTERHRKSQQQAKLLPKVGVLKEVDIADFLKGGSLSSATKADLLRRTERQGVQRLLDLPCLDDPAWALSMLRAAAPRLQALSVQHVNAEQLQVIQAMPHLRRLELDLHDDLVKQPAEVAPLQHAGGLHWLRTFTVPRATLEGLLTAHRHSLQEVHVNVGTPGTLKWPQTCADLDVLLQSCGLTALRRFVPRRKDQQHTESRCTAQLDAVRAALPSLTVECQDCGDILWEEM